MSDNITVKIIKNDGSEVVLTEEQWESHKCYDMEDDAEFMIHEDIKSLQFFINNKPNGSFYEYFEVELGDNTYYYNYCEYENGKLHGEYIQREGPLEGGCGCIIEESFYESGKLNGVRQTYSHGEYFDDEYGLNISTETYKKGKLHSYDDKPAKIEYAFVEDYCTEKVKESWYKDGKLHRKNGPAVIYNYNTDEYSEDDFYEYVEIEEFYSEEYWVNGKQVESSPEDTSKFQVRINGKGRKISLDKFNEEKEKFIERGIELLQYYKDGELHREDGPAVIEYYSDGSVYSESWYLNGETLEIWKFANLLGVNYYKSETHEVYLRDKKRHREDGPAVIWYWNNGSVSREEWYLNGKLHREDGPAKISYNDEDVEVIQEYWYLNGKSLESWEFANYLSVDHYKSETQEIYLKNGELHREDGPAVIKYNSDGSVRERAWYLNGKQHYGDGPALIKYNEGGSVHYESWSLNGVFHREDGPADIYYHDDGSVHYESWSLNGVFHREDGPAVIWYWNNGSVSREEWYLNGEELSEKEFNDRIKSKS